MIRLLLLLPAACCLLLSPARAQEHWDTYLAQFGNMPGSMLVDMGLRNNAPDKRYPYLVITGPRAQNCGKDGMPAKEEIEVLEDILNTTNNFLTGVTAKVLAGTFTYNCDRLNYYYVKDTTGIRNAIKRLYNRGYKDYSYALRITHDPEWKSYRTFLYPNEEMQNWMENTKVITGLMAMGDSLTRPHNITFNFFFQSDTARKAFVDYAVANGYSVARLNETKQLPVTYAVMLVRTAPVVQDDVSRMTAELKREALKHDGGYGGWDAKPQAPKAASPH